MERHQFLMKILSFSTALWLILSAASFAQLSINNVGVTETIDFTGFTGSGFTSSPGAGQLNSNEWQVTGLQAGDTTFGGTFTSGTYAAGTSSGAVTGEGIYAFNVGGANGATLGVQPDPNDFTPGSLVLRIQNNTNTTLSGFEIEYDLFIFNDTARSNALNFAYSSDNINYTSIGSLDRSSTATADSSPSWTSELSLKATISNISLSDGEVFYLSWMSDRVGGGGPTDDQIAIDNIGVTAIPEPSSFAFVLGTFILVLTIRNRRKSR